MNILELLYLSNRRDDSQQDVLLSNVSQVSPQLSASTSPSVIGLSRGKSMHQAGEVSASHFANTSIPSHIWKRSLQHYYSSSETFIITPWLAAMLDLRKPEILASAQILREHLKTIKDYERQIVSTESQTDGGATVVLPSYPDQQIRFNMQMSAKLINVLGQERGQRLANLMAVNPLFSGGYGQREFSYFLNDRENVYQPVVRSKLLLEEQSDRFSTRHVTHSDYSGEVGFFADRYTDLVAWEDLVPNE